MGISSLWSENDRDITWILLGSRDDSYCAVRSVNVYEGSEMMHTLQELNLDAARYRWVRSNPFQFLDWVDSYPHHIVSESGCNAYVDKELARDE